MKTGSNMNYVVKHLKRFISAVGVLAALILGLMCLTQQVRARPPIVIDFENLNTSGPGEGGQIVVSSQYASNGIIFNSPKVLDYSKGLAIPGFAHSKTKAVEQCLGLEFCATPIEMTFTSPQARVKVWVGRSSGSDQRTVLLRALNANGVEVGRATAMINANSAIRVPLEVTNASSAFVKARVSFLPETLLTNGLAVDDVEFDVSGPPPPCAATHDPTVVLTQPRNGQTVQQNAFAVQGTITTEATLVGATLTVASGGQTKALDLISAGLISGTRGALSLGPTQATDMLLPGENIVTAMVRDCRGNAQTTRIMVQFIPTQPAQQSPQRILETTYVNVMADPNAALKTRDVCSGQDFPQFAGFAGPPPTTLAPRSPLVEWMPLIPGSQRAPFGLEINGLPTDYETTVIGGSGTAVVLDNPPPPFPYPPEAFSYPSSPAGRSGDDLWFTHPFGYDREFYFAPDSPYVSLLAPSNNGNAGPPYSPDGEYQRAAGLAGSAVLGVETDQGFLPEYFLPKTGDRVATFGRWIADCGHKDWHTEIHPPLLHAVARVDPRAPTEATISRILMRPYLVGQTFMVGNDDDGPLIPHFIHELDKLFELRSLRIEAHPKLYIRPFAGNPIVHFVVRPPTPRRDPGDQLFVKYRFYRHPGVEVQLFPENSASDPYRRGAAQPPAASDGVRVVVRMIDAQYAPSDWNVCCLGKREWTITMGEVKRYKEAVFDSLLALAAVNLGALVTDLAGIPTDFYDSPFAPDPRYDDPPFPRRTSVTSQTAASLTGAVQPETVRTDGLGPAFPLLGWLRVEWARTGAVRRIRVIPQQMKLVLETQPGATSRTTADLAVKFNVEAIRRNFDGEQGDNSVLQQEVFKPARLISVGSSINMRTMYNLMPAEFLLTSEDAIRLTFTFTDNLGSIPIPGRPGPPTQYVINMNVDSTSDLAYTYNSSYTARSATQEVPDGGEHVEVTYRIEEDRPGQPPIPPPPSPNPRAEEHQKGPAIWGKMVAGSLEPSHMVEGLDRGMEPRANFIPKD